MKRKRRGPMSAKGFKIIISKFEEAGELFAIAGIRGRRPVNPVRVQQIDDATATMSSKEPVCCNK